MVLSHTLPNETNYPGNEARRCIIFSTRNVACAHRSAADGGSMSPQGAAPEHEEGRSSRRWSAQADAFRRRGFVVVESFFTSEELRCLRAECNAVQRYSSLYA